MIIVKIFKFESNLEYISSYLKDAHIPHFTDFKNKSLHAEEKNKDEILKIITKLKLDENDVESEEEMIEKSTSLDSDKKNYLYYGFITLFVGLLSCAEIINGDHFSKSSFWVIFSVIILISGSMFYQYFKHKKRNSN